jgi:hypothetical protein
VSKVHFLDSIPVENSRLYVACQLDDIEPREIAHTRMFAFDTPDDRKWFHHDVDMNVVSVAIKMGHANDLDESRRLIGLSKEGELDIFATGDYVWRTEKIPDAGVRFGSRGHMTHVRQIGSHLFACGHNGQVYKRVGDNSWIAIDSEIYKSIDYTSGDTSKLLNAMLGQRVLNCIDGSSEADVYTVGDDGYMAHFDGKKWKEIKLKTTEHLQWIRCYSPTEAWACGFNGTLLVGNVISGFRDVSTIDDNYTWWSLAKLDNKIYLAAAEGLFVYEGTGIKPVKTGLSPEHEDTYRVNVKDGALWSVGAKDIVRLMNGSWERFGHIDNPPIR